MKKLLAIIFSVACMLNHTNSQIIHVPAEQPTIQAGIDAAKQGDTVLVAEGSYLENINFNGKAITVASLFVIDKDTSHISKTIIDASQPSHKDSVTAVSMISDEDSTSVICGFTLTGGSGTVLENPDVRGGGGILIWGGGKIESNIIILNNVVSIKHGCGAGISCFLYTNLVIRGNRIINNEVNAWWGAHGAGIELVGAKERGYAMIEKNIIASNKGISSYLWAGGGGMRIWLKYPSQGYNVIVRNNLILGNQVEGTRFNPRAHGAGINIAYWDLGRRIKDADPVPRIYNNIVRDNISEFVGGGISVTNWPTAPDPGDIIIPQLEIVNNTIVNNTSLRAAGLYNYRAYPLLMNNIFWNDLSIDGCTEFSEPFPKALQYDVDKNKIGHIGAIYNNIRGGWPGSLNINQEPGFIDESVSLGKGSPCIGRGADSIEVEDKWYYAPANDFSGKKRPDLIDPYIDIGAFESEFARTVLAIADLSYIGFCDRIICPWFHKDTLHYLLHVSDTINVTNQIDVIPADWLADVDINHAFDITSPNVVDRTTIITVTSHDGVTQKVYTIEFNIVTGANEEDHTPLLIYPNPVTDMLNIETNVGGLHKIDITSLNGRVIFSTRTDGNSHQIDLSSFQKGVYFITIRTGDKIITDKIIKL